MKKTSKKIPILILLALIIALSTALTLVFTKPTERVLGATLTPEKEIAREYKVGDVVSFPSANFEHEGTNYPASATLLYPDGSYKKAETFRFERAGKYKLIYKATTSNNIVLEEEIDIKVNQTAYEFSGGRSTAVYGLDDSPYQTGVTGFKINLAKGETFTYNKPINLNDFNGGDALSFFVIPKKHVLRNENGDPLNDNGEVYSEGQKNLTDVTRDAASIIFKFTDIYDPSNTLYVKLGTDSKYSGGMTRISALSAGMAPGLLLGIDDENGDFKYYINGREVYDLRRHVIYNYGHFVDDHSFGGVSTTPVGQGFVKFGFDLENKLVLGNSKLEGDTRMIANLKDTNVFSEEWKGFTTGEVTVSITAENYSATAENITIMFNDFFGQDMSTNPLYEGGSIPVVDVQIPQQEIPLAVVGKEYPLFSALATDYDLGVKEVAPKVYYKYGFASRYRVNVVDGKFTPDRAGVYTAVYTTTDNYGHTTEKVVNIKAVSSAEITATLKGSAVISANVGEKILLDTVNITSEGSGVINTAVALTLNGEEIEIIDNGFTPTEVGKYTATYTITDYIGQTKTLSYDITVSAPLAPVMFATETPEQIFADGLLNGMQYLFPEYEVYAYSGTSKTQAPLTIKIIDADGEKEWDKKAYAVKADANGEITLVYCSGSYELARYVLSVREIKDGENLDLLKFFESDELNIAFIGERGVELYGDKDGSAKFINKIVANNFKITIGSNPDRSGLESVTVRVRDSVDQSIYFDVKFIQEVNNEAKSVGLRPFVNGVRLSMPINMRFDNGTNTSISYSNGKLTVDAYNAIVDKDALGRKFNGFPSGFAKVEFILEGVDKGAQGAIVVTYIGNQQINSKITKDTGKPSISLKEDYTVNNVIGTEMQVKDVYHGDVLDPMTTVTVTVTGADGKKIIDNEPINDQKFTMDKAGTYKIVYIVSDTTGNRANVQYMIYTIDNIAPEITIDGKINSTAKVGDSITLPKATANDNIDGAVEVCIFVRSVEGKIICLQGNEINAGLEDIEYQFSRVGTYTFMYSALDSSNNYSIKEFTVTVKEA